MYMATYVIGARDLAVNITNQNSFPERALLEEKNAWFESYHQ